MTRSAARRRARWIKGQSGNLIEFSGAGGQLHLHHATDLELDGTLRWNVDALERLGVLGHAGGPHFALKHAEVTEFQTVTAPELLDNLIKKTLYDSLDEYALGTRAVRNPVDELFLGDSSH